MKNSIKQIRPFHPVRASRPLPNLPVLRRTRAGRTNILILSAFLIFATNSQAQVRKHSIAYHALEVSYIGLQVADTHLTYKGLKMGAREANPAAKWMIDNHALIPMKVVTTAGFLYMARRIHKDKPKMAYAYLIGANLIYGAVVYNNYQVTVRLKI